MLTRKGALPGVSVGIRMNFESLGLLELMWVGAAARRIRRDVDVARDPNMLGGVERGQSTARRRSGGISHHLRIWAA